MHSFRYLVLISVAAFVGCSEGGTKYLTLEQLAQTPEFEGYEVVLKPTTEGPYMIAFSKDQDEVLRALKVAMPHKGKTYSIENEEVVGYGVRMLILENEKGDASAALLRTTEKIAASEPSVNPRPARRGRRGGRGGRGERGGQDSNSGDENKDDADKDDGSDKKADEKKDDDNKDNNNTDDDKKDDGDQYKRPFYRSG